jgi:phospholipid/cholesterol/gamma-HCH transport system ATP-binding protein
MKPLPKDGPDHGIDEGMKFLLLNEGKIAFQGTTEELVRSDDPWVKRYLE